MYNQLLAPLSDPISEKRKVKLEIDVNVGATEFQVKLDQTLQVDREGRHIKINNKEFNAFLVCIGKPKVCLGYVIDKSMDY